MNKTDQIPGSATWRDATRRLVALGTFLILLFALSPMVWASHDLLQLSIPIDTVVHADEGSLTELATASVPADFLDHTCSVSAHSYNQQSVHPGNDLVVESGVSEVTVREVEATPGGTVDATGMLELGSNVTVSLLMGPDEVFSAGMDVEVECLPAESTTTTQATPTTEASTTTVEVSDTGITSTTMGATTTTVSVSDTAVTSTTVGSTSTTVQVADTVITTTEPSTTSSIQDEVLGTEVLPFTGPRDTNLALGAVGLVALGIIMVVGARETTDRG